MTTKVAPWLQGLSDGWEAPSKQPTGHEVSSASHDAGSLRGSRSRIPRRSLSGLPSSFRSQRTSSIQRQRSPLAPVNSSNVNTLQRKPSIAKLKPTHSFSGSSEGDTFETGTVQQRSKSASPAKTQKTLEWKRRLLGREVGYGDQTDLFGPSGLENIFARTKEPENKPQPQSQPISSSRLNSDAPMPSSPPPWPFELQSHLSKEQSRLPLEALDEENLSDRDNDSFRSNPFDLQTSQLSNIYAPPRVESTQWSPNKAFIEPSTTDHDQGRTVSGQTELEHEGFSPVFISKHTGGNGQVDYAPIDPRTVKALGEANADSEDPGLEDSRQHNVVDDSVVENAIDESTFADSLSIDSAAPPDFSFSENLPTGSPFPNLGKNVQLERGGYSQCGSFKQKPLSPSESVLNPQPSRIPSMLLPPPVPAVSPPRQQNLQSERSSTPKHAGVPPTRSSHSPLKLFGDYDTFTNNRLLRRMSQLNPDGTVAISSKHLSSNVTPLTEQVKSERHSLSQRSSFGSGQLDNHSFNAEITITSASDPDENDSTGSPASGVHVPGSKIPLRFRVDTSVEDSALLPSTQNRGGEEEINVSNHSPSGSLTDVLLRKSSFQSGTEIDKEPHLSHGKRPPTSPSKHPTPKRRRTLHASELEAEVVEASSSFHKQIQESSNTRKRKDARPGLAQNIADPEVLASRKILRPRNPTPNQRHKQEIQAELREATEEFVSQQFEKLDAVLEEIESSMASDPAPSIQQQAETLASEVAAFTLNVQKSSIDSGERKRSVTTQDFLNEAMMIMKLIRAKARPQSNLGSVEEDELATAEPSMHDEKSSHGSSLLRVSRPPSREGSGWRSRSQHRQSDARVISHLRRYQEAEERDETDFIATSAASLQMDEEIAANENIVVVDEHSNIRITGPLEKAKHVQNDEDSRPLSQRSEQSNLNTISTQNSAGTSTGHTIATSSTRKSDNVGTLAPDAVAHLIGEQVGGMTFDKEKQRWVRHSKSPNKKQSSFLELPSTATSDDDPFREISDLPVDEQTELRRISSPGKVIQNQAEFQPSALNEKKSFHDVGATQERQRENDIEVRSTSNETVVSRPVTRDGNPPLHDLHSSSAHSKYSALASSQHEKVETRATSWSDEELATLASRAKVRQQQLAPSIANALLTHYGGPSIPGVVEVEEEDEASEHSSEHEHDHQGDSGSVEEIAKVTRVDNESSESGELSAVTFRDSAIEQIDFHKVRQTPPKQPAYHNSVRQISLRRQTLKSRFMGDVREQSELSIVAPLSGDRMVSLSLSVSRPIAKRGQVRDVTTLQSSPTKGDSSFLFSDLPEFTVCEEDDERPSEKLLAKRLAHHAAAEVNDRYALAVKDLVKTLTDVKDDEPFWEDIKELNLRSRSLASVYGLEDFCGRIQGLDVSENSLTHLQGAPVSVRILVARSNQLSNLTPWTHLVNLQYLDISGNQLESLHGLNSLIHLRELRADDNYIENIKGIFELDGLLKLSARRNKIRDVDFESCVLERLTELDLCDNQISKIGNVERLVALTKLKLNGNELEGGFKVQKSMPLLSTLSLRQCKLGALDVSTLPNLRHLDVDDNCLANIAGLPSLDKLEVLSMRRQNLVSGCAIDIFSQPLEARQVSLSGNNLPCLPLACNFLNIRHLELASLGLQELPNDFGLKMPNLRTLNLSFNSLRDVRPLLNIQKLESLSVCGNRLDRLRKSVATFAKLSSLASLDLRDNPLTQGFHRPVGSMSVRSQSMVLKSREVSPEEEDLEAEAMEKSRHVLPPGCPEEDIQHMNRLDEDTKLRRRVFELLLANSCRSLKVLDGLAFDRTKPLEKDSAWHRLVELGVIRKSN